jgi:dTDP-4-amino-4,6-dideoxygalactose transaminase
LAITDNRLKPVFVEPDINTYNIDISQIEQYITSRTRAIMIVHLYGRACWSEKILELGKKYDLKIIEDNAQASGAIVSDDNKNQYRTGSLGHAAAHSFYPGKNFGALGDGGAVTTDNNELANILRALANYGSKEKYVNNYQGLNSRLDEIQAAILRVKLPRLDADNLRRQKIAKHYIDNINLKNIVLPDFPFPDQVADIAQSHVWHLFILRHKQRDKLQKYLMDNGIQTLIHYPVPPHKQLAYKEYNHLNLAITEQISSEVLSLPISPVMDDIEVEKVVEKVNQFVE